MSQHNDDSSQSSAPSLPAVLTVPELAKLLRIGRNEAYAAINRGDIPGARRIGRTVRIDRDSVLAWLKAGQGRVSGSRGGSR